MPLFLCAPLHRITLASDDEEGFFMPRVNRAGLPGRGMNKK